MRKLVVFLLVCTFLASTLFAPMPAQSAPSAKATLSLGYDMTQQRSPGISVDWGTMPEYFKISNVRAEQQKYRDPLGRVTTFPVLAFTVEAQQSVMIAIFYVHFYDEDGMEVSEPSVVEFNPNYSAVGWSPGNRSRARVMLPTDLSQVRYIQFVEM